MTAEDRELSGFSWEHPEELIDFENHLAFAERMMEQYQWEAGTREGFQRRLKQIRDKQGDKLLNLSVIGEFSTGKSTLINAMLRTELLASSALQGTTAACTVIEYGDRPGLRLTCRDGSSTESWYEDTRQLAQRLSEFTERPDAARELYSAQVFLPSPTLLAGFRIIDTPGTNALEQWHEEVTVRTIREISDLSIVLVDATKPLPDTLLCFIEENLSTVLNQCAFLVTKLDLIPQRERDRMMAYIAMKLEQRLELKSPLVLGYDAPAVLRHAAGQSGPEEQALLEASLSNESALLFHMRRHKALAQTKKIIALIDGMYEAVGGQLEGLSEKCRNDLAQLLRTRQADLSGFVERQRALRTASWADRAGAVRTQILNQLHERAEAVQRDILSDLDRLDTLNELKTYMNERLANSCIGGAYAVIIPAQRDLGQIGGLLQEEITAFQQEFEQSFRDLAVLDGAPNLGRLPLPQPSRISTEGLDVAGKYLAQELGRENRAFYGGAAAGAAVGTAIAPVVGTLVGAVVGGIGGAFLGPSCAQVRANVKEKLRPPMKGYFTNVTYRASLALDSYMEQAGQSLTGELDRYLSAYQSTVERRIQEEEARRAAIEEQIRAIRNDMDNIQQRKFRLNSVREQLDQAGRRE